MGQSDISDNDGRAVVVDQRETRLAHGLGVVRRFLRRVIISKPVISLTGLSKEMVFFSLITTEPPYTAGQAI